MDQSIVSSEPSVDWTKVKRVSIVMTIDLGTEVAETRQEIDPKLLASAEKPSWLVMSEMMDVVGNLFKAIAKRQTLRRKKGLL